MDRPSSHSQKVPYARKEGRKSLFSKMKDSVRDVLSPSWLSGLVTTVKKESPPNTTAVETSQQFTTSDASSMSVQQNTPSMPAVFQGQTMLNGQPRTLDFNNQRGSHSPFSQSNLPPPMSEFTSAQLPLNRFTEKTDSIMAQEDTMSQRSDSSRSTSGCSSMAPQTESGAGREKRKVSLDGSDSGTSPLQQGEPASKRQKLQVSISAHQPFSRRLSDTFTAGSGHTVGSGRPAFNTRLFASPLNETSILGTSFHESSFYPGKTTFGGRSSLSFRKKKVDLNQSLPSRLSVPVKAFMKARPRVNPSQEAVTSSTAKRILEALDKMPTPLNDARRIPMMMPRQWTESPSFFSRDRTSPRSGPPTQKLNISSQASISRNRQVTFASSDTSVQDKTERAPARHQDTVILDPQGGNASGKMKRDKSYHRGSASVKPVTLDEEETVIIPDLKTDFTLPVSSFSLPKFTFGGQQSKGSITIPATGQTKSNTSNATSNATSSANSISMASPEKTNMNFTFSSPIVETVPVNKPESPEKRAFGGFQFSSPLSVDKPDKTVNPQQPPSSAFSSAAVTTSTTFGKPQSSFSTPPSMEFSFAAAAKPKTKPNASELKQGSVMDILGGFSSSKPSSTGSSQTASEKPFTATPISVPGIGSKSDFGESVASKTAETTSASEKQSSWGGSFGIVPGNWICKICLIQNKKEAETCGACQSSRPSDKDSNTAVKATSPPRTDSLFAKFKPASGQWECEVCLLQNKPDDTKCVACQTSKPLKVFKQPAGDWTCDTCLVVNKETAANCVACTYARPGPPRTQAVPSCAKSFTLSQNSGSIQASSTGGFTFNKPSVSEPAQSGFTFNKPAASEPAQSGFTFNKPAASEPVKSGFTFQQPATVSDKTEPELKSGGFKFESSSSVSSVTGSGFKFGSDIAVSKVEEKSNFASSGGFKFGAENSNQSTSVSSGGFNVGNTEKKSDIAGSSVKMGGFQFGKSSDSGSNKENKLSEGTGGFVFGSKQDTNSAVKDPVQASVSLTSGFSDTVVPFTNIDSTKTNSFGSFTASTTSNSALPSSSSTLGFSLSSKTTAESCSASQENSKPVFGGFNFTQAKSDPTLALAKTAGQGNFTFQTSKPTDNTDTGATATKRNRDDDGGETTAKKSFSFGQATNGPTPNSLFQFGATSSTSSNSTASTPSLFVFGQKTSAASSSTVTTGLFTFGAANKSTSSGTLGGTSSTPFAFGSSAMNSTSVPTATPSFGLTNSSTATPSFGLTNSSTVQPSFGQTNNSTAQPTFGQTNNSIAPLSFGQKNSSTAPFSFGTTSSSTTAPSFGLTKSFTAAAPSFGMTNSSVGSSLLPSTGTSAAATSGLFQFGQANKPAVTSSPFAFGVTSNAQPSNPAPVFGNGLPSSFDFGVQNTNNAISSSSAVFKFGASQQQAPAVTPSFAFGGQNPSVGSVFGGNAPSTTPAFGATPSAFGSANPAGSANPPSAFGDYYRMLANTGSYNKEVTQSRSDIAKPSLNLRNIVDTKCSSSGHFETEGNRSVDDFFGTLSESPSENSMSGMADEDHLSCTDRKFPVEMHDASCQTLTDLPLYISTRTNHSGVLNETHEAVTTEHEGKPRDTRDASNQTDEIECCGQELRYKPNNGQNGHDIGCEIESESKYRKIMPESNEMVGKESEFKSRTTVVPNPNEVAIQTPLSAGLVLIISPMSVIQTGTVTTSAVSVVLKSLDSPVSFLKVAGLEVIPSVQQLSTLDQVNYRNIYSTSTMLSVPYLSAPKTVPGENNPLTFPDPGIFSNQVCGTLTSNELKCVNSLHGPVFSLLPLNYYANKRPATLAGSAAFSDVSASIPPAHLFSGFNYRYSDQLPSMSYLQPSTHPLGTVKQSNNYIVGTNHASVATPCIPPMHQVLSNSSIPPINNFCTVNSPLFKTSLLSAVSQDITPVTVRPFECISPSQPIPVSHLAVQSNFASVMSVFTNPLSNPFNVVAPKTSCLTSAVCSRPLFTNPKHPFVSNLSSIRHDNVAKNTSNFVPKVFGPSLPSYNHSKSNSARLNCQTFQQSNSPLFSCNRPVVSFGPFSKSDSLRQNYFIPQQMGTDPSVLQPHWPFSKSSNIPQNQSSVIVGTKAFSSPHYCSNKKVYNGKVFGLSSPCQNFQTVMPMTIFRFHSPTPVKMLCSGGIFEVGKQPPVDDIVMEDPSIDCGKDVAGGAEKSVEEFIKFGKKVTFSTQTEREYKTAQKSVLKTRTKEMVTAFGSASMDCEGDDPDEVCSSTSHLSQPRPNKATSAVFGGQKDFCDLESGVVLDKKSFSSISTSFNSIGADKVAALPIGNALLNVMKETTACKGQLLGGSTQLPVHVMPQAPLVVSCVSSDANRVQSGVFRFTAVPVTTHSVIKLTLMPEKVNSTETKKKPNTYVSAFCGKPELKKKNADISKESLTAFSQELITQSSSMNSAHATERSSSSVSSSSSATSDTSGSSSSTSCSSDSDSYHSLLHSSSSTEDADGMDVAADVFIKRDDTPSTFVSAFSGKGNRSWNALPSAERDCLELHDIVHVVQEHMVQLISIKCHAYEVGEGMCDQEGLWGMYWHSTLDNLEFSSSFVTSPWIIHWPSFLFGFGSSQPSAPIQSNPVFQFGKSADNAAAPGTQSGFIFGANPAGLGATPSFNFSAQSPAAGAFTIGAGGTSDRKIKKAVRKIRR
ncbi:serine-rich adhesin for platelets-like isoform X2 [Dreissena polymorpha]|uniref:serine-rich adhesin for platelets-like isoform X2 n=1 Tax=Dreissena polymorpha TaxID=45954 RepID=UPI002265580D|nr:serine-rich adhesin for platelets-like isoform X2 [Dreissena polymorpha]